MKFNYHSPKEFLALSKKAALSLALAAVFVPQVSANDIDMTKLHKQLSIMNKILSSSLTDQQQGASKVTGVSSTYLAGQGVVFTVNSKASRGHWGAYSFELVVPDVPVAPVAPAVGNVEFELEHSEIQETITREMERATRSYERAFEVMHEQREEVSELRHEQHELAMEQRELDRALREVEFRKKHADKEQLESLEEKIVELTQERKKVLKEKEKLTAKATKFSKQQKANKAQREKERKGYYQNLAASFSETLCLYGNGLRALPKNEKVSVILKSGGAKLDKRYQDQIMVFDKSQILACSNEKISSAKLLEKSEQYYF